MYKEYVPHPRYGDRPDFSGKGFSREDVLESWWGYSKETFFPETAIRADVANQNYSVFPRSLYVDIEKKCRDCGRDFLFFAREQKHWYEELYFTVDAQCVKCIDCRKKEQEIRVLAGEYENLLKKEDRTEEEMAKLKLLASELYEIGYIRNKRKLGEIA